MDLTRYPNLARQLERTNSFVHVTRCESNTGPCWTAEVFPATDPRRRSRPHFMVCSATSEQDALAKLDNNARPIL